ncbi:MAG TPA: nicotinate-nucleotide--dimethylbenzimidazole phosphoribosyltransferase [Candidatus Acidoferrales bacterium]|nr:nicotinate-nucleotide--dimethylbenzimidazole phosphoribosyltransferase [Candidatus Acidoferrales bacterium]
MSDVGRMKSPEASITELADLVPTIESKWRELALLRLTTLTKPLGSLGRLEDIAVRLAAIQAKEFPNCTAKTIFTLAADHGVAAENVSAYPKAVTKQMVLNFLAGGAAINVLCRQFGIEVVIVDVGVDGEIDASGRLLRYKIANGTRNMACGPAMNEAEVVAALNVGIDLAAAAAERGATLIGTGEMGIGNTTSASAITAVLTGKPVAQITGRGTGLDASGVNRKIGVIERALAVNRPVASDPLDILRKLGGLEIAGITGLILGAAAHRIAVVVDGFISTAAAAIAYAIQPRVGDVMFAAHRSSEPGHAALLDFIHQRPLLDLEMRLGEGTGSALAMSVIEAAAKLFNEMATFSSAGVSGAVA